MTSRTVQPTILLTLQLLFQRFSPQGCSNERLIRTRVPETDPSSIEESRFPAPSISQFGDLSLLCPPFSRSPRRRVPPSRTYRPTSQAPDSEKQSKI
ncbi:hypothetical protein P692DRAFT_20738222 [Suillus brevipes Sb2]|nr:hypothetical protein P692DRAFT_20738222 [Suillus brevipes Sb2]